MTDSGVRVLCSKYKNLAGELADNLSGRNPVFYGLGPHGEHRCLEEETLYSYEPEHNYRAGLVTMRDGTRMAIAQEKARQAAWNDLATMMAERGVQ